MGASPNAKTSSLDIRSNPVRERPHVAHRTLDSREGRTCRQRTRTQYFSGMNVFHPQEITTGMVGAIPTRHRRQPLVGVDLIALSSKRLNDPLQCQS